MPDTERAGWVGASHPKLNGQACVTGRAVYADDVQLPGMLYGRVLHSPLAHARILNIDREPALRMPGVVDVIDAAHPGGLSLFPRKEVCYSGQKVAVAAAENPRIAEDALQAIDVRYDRLPAYVDVELAIRAGAGPVRLDLIQNEVADGEGRPLVNVAGHRLLEEGDVEQAFVRAAAVVERTYRIPTFHQNYLEPNVATARMEPDGRITIWTACQGAFAIRDAVAADLQIPHRRIRVIPVQVGGAFGAKNSTFVEAHAALLAMRTGRPVKVRMNRWEEFVDGRPAPGVVIRLKMAADAEGRIIAVEGRAIWDVGWAGGGADVSRLCGLYRIPNVKLEGFAVRTNKPAPGAYRAPGSPQTAFARESTVDLLARALEMDPLEFRLLNAIGRGDRSLAGTPLPSDWLKRTLAETAHSAGWGEPTLKPNQGRGIACGEWTNASGPTSVSLTLGEDGSVFAVTGQVDISGVHTALAQIIAEELRIPAEKVTVTQADTDMVPYTSLSAGSKSTVSAGTAAREAAVRARLRILREGARHLEVDPMDVELADEAVRVEGAPHRRVALSVLAAEAISSREGPIEGGWVLGSLQTYPSYSVDIATVEVDPDTGKVALLDLVAGQDVGRAINRAMVEGQMQGGAVQGVGLGLMEGYRYGPDGRVLNPNFLDYPLPTAEDVPPVRTVIVEEKAPSGPHGAKGVGEPPIIPGAAAIANAIHDAVGVRIAEAPITPERVLAALRTHEETAAAEAPVPDSVEALAAAGNAVG